MMATIDNFIVRFSRLYAEERPKSEGKKDNLSWKTRWKKGKDRGPIVGNRYACSKWNDESRYCRTMFYISYRAEQRSYMRDLRRKFRKNEFLFGPPTCYKDDPEFKKYYK